MITEADARQFQILFEKEYGQTISLKEAFECVESLVEMVKLTYKPIKKADYEKCTSQDTGI